jgi:predicted CXXCH cytochrome family protein
MKKIQLNLRTPAWMMFAVVFALSLALGVAISMAQPAAAAPGAIPPAQEGTATATPESTPEVSASYVGSDTCAACHKDIHETWAGTLHSQAFSSPVFQEDWVKQGSADSCLECHTTGFDAVTGQYSEEGVTCESCHGPMQSDHPQNPMPVTPDYTLCARCHKTTTDEWRASRHGAVNINCESCHNPHSQAPRADTVNELCGNCHKDKGSSFTHGTHANAGLQCSDCHMATAAHTDSTGGLFATGHTFTVGSEACINCHKDTVHTRDTILQLSGQDAGTAPTSEELEKQVQEQEQQIQSLEAQSSVRLYTGLMQGAIVGLAMGGVAAWIVSRRIRFVEVEENDEKGD